MKASQVQRSQTHLLSTLIIFLSTAGYILLHVWQSGQLVLPLTSGELTLAVAMLPVIDQLLAWAMRGALLDDWTPPDLSGLLSGLMGKPPPQVVPEPITDPVGPPPAPSESVPKPARILPFITTPPPPPSPR